MLSNPQQLATALMMLVPMILSLSVHEFAHAWSASKLGDDTAERMGRLTLNPLPHIDVLGTLILPLVLQLTGSGFMFGWAKPVPVNPVRFTRKVTMKSGMMVTAAAGPLSNVVLAVGCTVLYALAIRFAPQTLEGASGKTGLHAFFEQAIVLNVVLALFNLLPVPPLDGSRIVDGLMPARLRSRWEGFTQYSAFLLMGVMLFGGYLIQGPLGVVLGWMSALIDSIAGV